MRILLAGPARTGNEWVRNILSVIYKLKILPSSQFPRSSDGASFSTFLEEEFEDNAILHESFPPTKEFLLAARARECHLITVLRNPYDTFVSVYHHIQDFPEEFIEGNGPAKSVIIDKPIDHPEVLQFLELGFRQNLVLGNQWLQGGQSIIVRYEQLHADPFGEVKRVTDQIQPVEDALITKAIEMSGAVVPRTEIPHQVCLASLGEWKNHLTAAHLRIFKSRHAALVKGLGYEVLEEGAASPVPRLDETNPAPSRHLVAGQQLHSDGRSRRIILVGPAKTGNFWVLGILAGLYQLSVVNPELENTAALETYVGYNRFAERSIFISHVPPSRRLFRMLAPLSVQMVTVLRNPYDMFVSLYHFVQHFNPDHLNHMDPARDLIGKPLDHPDVFHFLENGLRWSLLVSLRWLECGQSIIVRYEQLHGDTFQEVKRLSERIEPVEDRLILEVIKANDAAIVRKRKGPAARHVRTATVGDWRNHLNERHLTIIRSRYADLITRLGYELF